MNLQSIDRAAKLARLADDHGFDSVDDMIAATITDSVSPGICIHCDATAEVEPDQDQGWCEACGRNSVVSVPILAGLI